MARNIKNGNHLQKIEWVNDSGVAVLSGAIVVVGSAADAALFVAMGDIAVDAKGVLGYNCEVEAPKVSAAVFAQGESLTWDVSAIAFNDNQATAASGDVQGAASRAEAAGANTEATCRVWLTGIPSALTA